MFRLEPMQIIRKSSAAAIVLCLILSSLATEGGERAEVAALSADIRRIDERMSGRFGVFVKHLGEGWQVGHRTDRDWYLASTVKIPLAVAVLQKVEDGELSLEQELQLAESDFVDGSGELLWHEPGDRFTIDELIGHSIRDSDSTATDMLIRLLGEESLNQQIRTDMVPEGFGPITTILQVRYDAYGEIHRDVQKLTNRDFIELKTESDPEGRYRMLLQKLAIEGDSITVGSSAEAFERYYARGINSADLEAFGLLLERLVRRELLNDVHTRKLLDRMETVTTGDRRIKAGLPDDARFAQKTGTLIARSCNVGILNPHRQHDAVVVAACAEAYEELGQAEQAFEALGAALTRAGLVIKGSDAG
jgi:beta-lactamase class A